MTGRAPSGQALVASDEAQLHGLHPAGFDPSRIMREFYLSRYYEQNCERPADNVLAAIEFTIDRHLTQVDDLSPARAVGLLAVRMLDLASRANLYVGIKIRPASAIETEGGDAKQAPSQSDESAARNGDAQQ